MDCAKCTILACDKLESDDGKLPKFCPILNNNTLIEEEFENYKGENYEIAVNAAKVEAKGYCQWTRLEEIVEFAKVSGYQKLGLAFCIGLQSEANTTTKVLESQGFDVSSIICKTGGIKKEKMGLEDNEKVRPGTNEAICNPIAQAELLNNEGTELNLILGLCVGHDTLFIKHSGAPVTIFAAKDRVLAHNPLACVYTNYHLKQRFPEL